MKQKIILFVFASLLILPACQKQRPVLNSDDEKTIYAIGYDMGIKLKTLQLSMKERDTLKMGIDDGVSGKTPQVEPREFLAKVGDMIRTRQKAFAENEKEESKKFMDDAEKKEKAEKTNSGLIYISVKEGEGEKPKSSDRVKVNYHGTLRSGEVFDSTRERKEPAIFRLDRVIKCWQEGVQKMKVGGQSELYCPSDLAYGDRGAPPKIPPGAVLKFEVELLEIVREDDEKSPKKEASKKEDSGENKKEASKTEKGKESKPDSDKSDKSGEKAKPASDKKDKQTDNKKSSDKK